MPKSFTTIEQNNLDVCEAVAELFNVDLGGWRPKDKKMTGAEIMRIVSLRLLNEKKDDPDARTCL